MEARDLRDVLETTQVSNAFIVEQLPHLDAPALRLYLALLYRQQQGQPLEGAACQQLAGCTDKERVQGLWQLAQQNLITLSQSEERIGLIDLRDRAVRKLLQEARSEGASDLGNIQPPLTDERETPDALVSLLESINETFFQGKMSLTWSRAIHQIYQTYPFEPQVIYLLIRECFEHGKLRTPAYMNSVAKRWFADGILSFSDLEQDKQSRQAEAQILNRVASYLNRGTALVEGEARLVRHWIRDFGFDQTVIELLLDKLPHLRDQKLKNLDRIAKRWYEAGWSTPEAIREGEAMQRQSNQAWKRLHHTGGQPWPETEVNRSYEQDAAGLLDVQPQQDEVDW